MGGTNNGVTRDSTKGNGVPSSAGQAGTNNSDTTTTSNNMATSTATSTSNNGR